MPANMVSEGTITKAWHGTGTPPPPPHQWHGGITLNLIELLASAVSTYMNIQKMVQVSHILDFMDISSALGLIHKASFDPVN